VIQAPHAADRRPAWEPSVETLRFFLGGREMGAISVKAMSLNTPFSDSSTNLDESAPAFAFPDGVDALVVPAQPNR
jgi:hypothetical protein